MDEAKATRESLDAAVRRARESPHYAGTWLDNGYLDRYVAALGLSGARVLEDSGHLTRCRAPDSPVGRGRVLLAGDAAGVRRAVPSA